jgi:hypothetical protein
MAFRRKKKATVLLDMTAAYETMWNSGLLFKLSKIFPSWFANTVDMQLNSNKQLKGRKLVIQMEQDQCTKQG